MDEVTNHFPGIAPAGTAHVGAVSSIDDFGTWARSNVALMSASSDLSDRTRVLADHLSSQGQLRIPTPAVRLLALVTRAVDTAWLDSRLTRDGEHLIGKIVVIDRDTMTQLNFTTNAAAADASLLSSTLITKRLSNLAGLSSELNDIAGGLLPPDSLTIQFADGTGFRLPVTSRAGVELVDALLMRQPR